MAIQRPDPRDVFASVIAARKSYCSANGHVPSMHSPHRCRTCGATTDGKQGHTILELWQQLEAEAVPNKHGIEVAEAARAA